MTHQGQEISETKSILSEGVMVLERWCHASGWVDGEKLVCLICVCAATIQVRKSTPGSGPDVGNVGRLAQPIGQGQFQPIDAPQYFQQGDAAHSGFELA